MSQSKRRWSEDFRRVTPQNSTRPRFSVRGSMGYLYEPYRGGHAKIDRIIDLCREERIEKREKRDLGSPMNDAQAHDVYYDLLDGGLRVRSGNYFFQERGAYIEGNMALRWILHRLGYDPPRKLKAEDRVPSVEELERSLGPTRRPLKAPAGA